MSPTYEYRCGDGHVSDRRCRYEDRPKTIACHRCGRRARPIISLSGVEPDGVHSYAPNIGDPVRFERQQEAIKNRTGAIDREGS